MDTIKQECMKILENEGVNPISSIDFDVNKQLYSLTFEYIIDTYMLGVRRVKTCIFECVKKGCSCKRDGDRKEFFKGMGQLLLMTHLSKKN